MAKPSRRTTSRRPRSGARAEAPADASAEPAVEVQPAPDGGDEVALADDDAPGDEPPVARTATPAVIAATLFVLVCALVSIAFVASRGGLALPLASASAPPIAIASPSPSIPVTTPTASAPPIASPTPPASPTPSPVPASPGPTAAPSSGPSATPDPLAALPPCPDRPGCSIYTVRRGDTLGRIADRFAVPYQLVLGLNPEISDPSVIVIGQPIYLGRSLLVRLEPCPNRDACRLYIVQPGDRLSTIAGRFGLSVAAILEINPAIDDPNTIYSGQKIRLPDPTA